MWEEKKSVLVFSLNNTERVENLQQYSFFNLFIFYAHWVTACLNVPYKKQYVRVCGIIDHSNKREIHEMLCNLFFFAS